MSQSVDSSYSSIVVVLMAAASVACSNASEPLAQTTQAVATCVSDDGCGTRFSFENTSDKALSIVGTQPITSPMGKGLLFDGDDYIAINDRHYSEAGQIDALTVCAFVRTVVDVDPDILTPMQVLNANWSILDFDRSEYFNLYVRGDGKVGFSTADLQGIDDFSGESKVNDGKWYHICGVYDGARKRIFVNGTEDASQASPHENGIGTGRVVRYGFIGDGSEASTPNGTRNNIHYRGAIDEVVLEESVLSDEDIRTMALGRVRRSPPIPRFYYTLEEELQNSTARVVPGLANGALAFDGAEYVPLPDSLSASDSELSACVIAKTSFSGDSQNSNWSLLDFDHDEHFNLYITGDSGQVGFSSTGENGVTDDFISDIVVNDGQWHHICAVYDGFEKHIYVDSGSESERHADRLATHAGESVGTGTTRFGIIGDGSEAGTFNGPRNNLFFEGEVDEVALYSRALSESDIGRLRTVMESGGPCSEATVCEGNFLLRGNDSLDPVANCSEITGSLSIYQSTRATNLHQLYCLQSAKSIWMSSNPKLVSTEGLANLTSVEETLRFQGNSQLADIEGLGKLKVAGSVYVGGNSQITGISGMNGLESIGGSLWIISNQVLAGISGLQGLEELTRLDIKYNPDLENISGLSNIETVRNGLHIESNDSLNSLAPLGNITGNIGRMLIIARNPSLENLTGLEGITAVSGDDTIGGRFVGVRIYENRNLGSLAGLDNLESVTDEVHISDNESLFSLAALGNLTSVGSGGGGTRSAGLIIRNNELLPNLNGLGGLQSIGDNIAIRNNVLLSNVAALSNVIGFNSQLSITDNPQLTAAQINILETALGVDCLQCSGNGN